MTDLDTPILRDSGYSESLHSASYEEFVLPSIDKDKTPPPLPPKNTQPQSNSESNGRNQISKHFKWCTFKNASFNIFIF